MNKKALLHRTNSATKINENQFCIKTNSATLKILNNIIGDGVSGINEKVLCIDQTQLLGEFQVFESVTGYQKSIKQKFCTEKTLFVGDKI